MLPLDHFCCKNANCKHFNAYNQGNIAIRSIYGINNDHILLYCKECKVTFTPTKENPLYKAHLSKKTIRDIISLSSQGAGVRGIAEHLEISPKAVNRNIIKIGELCAAHLASAIVSLDLVEVQLDEFWSFVKKNVLKRTAKHLDLLLKGQSGSGQQR
jgi:transposase-like protein